MFEMVILNCEEKDEDGERLYWSNDIGWCLLSDATVFSSDEMLTFNLPMGGAFVVKAWADGNYPDDDEEEVEVDEPYYG